MRRNARVRARRGQARQSRQAHRVLAPADAFLNSEQSDEISRLITRLAQLLRYEPGTNALGGELGVNTRRAVSTAGPHARHVSEWEVDVFVAGRSCDGYASMLYILRL